MAWRDVDMNMDVKTKHSYWNKYQLCNVKLDAQNSPFSISKENEHVT